MTFNYQGGPWWMMDTALADHAHGAMFTEASAISAQRALLPASRPSSFGCEGTRADCIPYTEDFLWVRMVFRLRGRASAP